LVTPQESREHMPDEVNRDQVVADADARKPYEAPRVLATYSKQELEEVIQPQGVGGCGCGCGGG
jgi:hypothetical protein